MRIYREFFRDETGAVTIDWVAVTAGILLLGIMVVYAIFNGGVSSLVADINGTLASVDPNPGVGIEPALYDMVLASGAELPSGSVVTGAAYNPLTDAVDTTFTRPDGSTVTTSEMNAAGNTVPFTVAGVGGAPDTVISVSGGLAVGTTVSSGNSLTLPGGGGTVTQSSISGT